MVGPFFFVDSNVLDYHGWICHKISEKNAEKCGDFLNSEVGHDKLFDMKFGKSGTEIEYFEFPRGRVVYNTATNTHTIYR